MADHVPATLHFNNISYRLPSGKSVLSHVTGTVRPGELLAIMGASGAGKSTLLDILARKAKTGQVTGDMYINGREVPDEEIFRRVVGYVDQEDTLLSTLTVYEAVLYSALLRLPREMSHQAKVYRTLETMNELGILGIKDSRIGESGKRSISGGEKRRVSIACELVTGPSILFLDEPTSGKLHRSHTVKLMIRSRLVQRLQRNRIAQRSCKDIQPNSHLHHPPASIQHCRTLRSTLATSKGTARLLRRVRTCTQAFREDRSRVSKRLQHCRLPYRSHCRSFRRPQDQRQDQWSNCTCPTSHFEWTS
jgi:ABC-type lipoprotein export system ATPase subunit